MAMNSSALDSLRHFRFHAPHAHLAPVFGEGWFGTKAEAFARFFGTPTFLVGQTLVVFAWIAVNSTGLTTFDLYPFILLNLAFSLQAAYAAPLILLAQTRQADRDAAHADADARHREEIATEGTRLQKTIADQTERIHDLLEQNTKLTEITAELSRRIADLTSEIHGKVVKG
jgi:uncharacterized membrane protein